MQNRRVVPTVVKPADAGRAPARYVLRQIHRNLAAEAGTGLIPPHPTASGMIGYSRFDLFQRQAPLAHQTSQAASGSVGIGWVSVAVKKGAKMAEMAARRGQPFNGSLSLLMEGLFQNGPELSRARRCWARRSDPFTARTVLRPSKKRERLPAPGA